MRFIITIVVAVSILLCALLLSSRSQHGPLKVSGFLESDEIRVGSRVGGRVKSVKVVEGQRVHRGDVLLELEPFDLVENRDQAAAVVSERAAEYQKRKSGLRPEEIAQAEAKADQLRAQLQKAQNGPREQEIAAAKAELQLAEAELKLAEQKFKRAESLNSRAAISAGEFDQIATERSVARSRLQVLTENLKLLQAGTRPEEIAAAKAQLREAEEAAKLAHSGYRPEDITQAQAGMDAARSAFAATEKQIGELAIASPTEATVESLDLQPGDLLSPNAPAASLSDLENVWVRAYVPENQLDIKIGQKLTVTVDSFPNRKFQGEINYIARQAEFTPGNVQTPEERSKQVFRIKVKMIDGLDVLRPGMATDVWLEPPR